MFRASNRWTSAVSRLQTLLRQFLAGWGWEAGRWSQPIRSRLWPLESRLPGPERSVPVFPEASADKQEGRPGPPACSSPTRALSALPRTRHPTTVTAASGSDSPTRHHSFPAPALACPEPSLRLVSPASLCRPQSLTCPQNPAQLSPPPESLLRSPSAEVVAQGMGSGARLLAVRSPVYFPLSPWPRDRAQQLPGLRVAFR